MKMTKMVLRVLALTVMMMGLIGCSSQAGAQAGFQAGSTDDGYWIECSTCHGGTLCRRCDGRGRTSNGRMCTLCNGSGLCSRCEGKGQRELIMVNGKEYVVCANCHGNGVCKHCNGSGRGDSVSLLGSSYGTKCYFCKGNRKCSECKGKGYTSW